MGGENDVVVRMPMSTATINQLSIVKWGRAVWEPPKRVAASLSVEIFVPVDGRGLWDIFNLFFEKK